MGGGEIVGEIIATQKHVARLFQTIIVGKVDVAEGSGNRCTLFIPAQLGMFNRRQFHSKGSFFREWQEFIGRGKMTQIYKGIG